MPIPNEIKSTSFEELFKTIFCGECPPVNVLESLKRDLSKEEKSDYPPVCVVRITDEDFGLENKGCCCCCCKAEKEEEILDFNNSINPRLESLFKQQVERHKKQRLSVITEHKNDFDYSIKNEIIEYIFSLLEYCEAEYTTDEYEYLLSDLYIEEISLAEMTLFMRYDETTPLVSIWDFSVTNLVEMYEYINQYFSKLNN